MWLIIWSQSLSFLSMGKKKQLFQLSNQFLQNCVLINFTQNKLKCRITRDLPSPHPLPNQTIFFTKKARYHTKLKSSLQKSKKIFASFTNCY